MPHAALQKQDKKSSFQVKPRQMEVESRASRRPQSPVVKNQRCIGNTILQRMRDMDTMLKGETHSRSQTWGMHGVPSSGIVEKRQVRGHEATMVGGEGGKMYQSHNLNPPSHLRPDLTRLYTTPKNRDRDEERLKLRSGDGYPVIQREIDSKGVEDALGKIYEYLQKGTKGEERKNAIYDILSLEKDSEYATDKGLEELLLKHSADVQSQAYTDWISYIEKEYPKKAANATGFLAKILKIGKAITDKHAEINKHFAKEGDYFYMTINSKTQSTERMAFNINNQINAFKLAIKIKEKSKDRTTNGWTVYINNLKFYGKIGGTKEDIKYDKLVIYYANRFFDPMRATIYDEVKKLGLEIDKDIFKATMTPFYDLFEIKGIGWAEEKASEGSFTNRIATFIDKNSNDSILKEEKKTYVDEMKKKINQNFKLTIQ